jgi:hypothetical protein
LATVTQQPVDTQPDVVAFVADDGTQKIEIGAHQYINLCAYTSERAAGKVSTAIRKNSKHNVTMMISAIQKRRSSGG